MLAVLVALPILGVLLAAAQFWSTAGAIARYRPEEPSRLYAAPLVLRQGAPIDRRALVTDLQTLGYRPSEGRIGVGEYAIDGGTLRLGLRRAATVDGSWRSLAGGPTKPTVVEAILFDGRLGPMTADGAPLGSRAVVTLGRPLVHTYYGPDLRECRPVQLAEVPAHLVGAVLAAEDATFYRHSGLAPGGIARAAWQDLRSGEVRQGGSTITQQLVKNLAVGPRRTLGRKLHEAVLAVLVESRTTKEQVLESYLNEIYWGSTGEANLHGIGAAARGYFGKDASELTLAEAATLAGMIRSPAAYSPVTAPAAARVRRDWVLDRMVRRHFLSPELAAHAKAEPLTIHPLAVAGHRAPWFAVAMAAEARERFGIERLGGTGYRLESTLSSADQAIAEREVKDGLAELDQADGGRRVGAPLQAGLVSLEPESGRIRAWVGGRDWKLGEFDHVAQARRQAGSAFKPVVYAAALMDGRLRPWELLRDSPVVVGTGNDGWRPVNYDRTYHGNVTPAEAMAQSLNIPTVRIAVRTGFARVAEVARSMGITSPMDAVPSLALGTCAVTPLELATVYATLASSGRRPTVWGLEAVVDRDGEQVVGEELPTPVRVIGADHAYEVTSMLRDVLAFGTGAAARAYGVPAGLAGKTGTTDDRRDNWFAGYSGDRVTVVWVGYDDNGRTRLSGSRAALPLWSRFVAEAEPAAGWAPLDHPAGTVTVVIDPDTGLLATPACPRRVVEEMPAWRAPLRRCDVHAPESQLAQLGTTAPSLGASSGVTLAELLAAREGGSEFIAGSSDARARAHERGQVTRLYGEGTDIQLGRGPAVEAETLSVPGPGI